MHDVSLSEQLQGKEVLEESVCDLDEIIEILEDKDWSEDELNIDFNTAFVKSNSECFHHLFSRDESYKEVWLPLWSLDGLLAYAEPIEDDFTIFYRRDECGAYE
ncbi:MAG: hypothetical protein QF849_02180 [Pseudomonadales bacterium]|nr:hypothetical protein [Pseudomonadales bacterium]